MEDQKNENLILNPEFIPFYPAMFRAGFLAIDCVLFGFIRFFLANNDKFFCTDKQIGEMLGVSAKTVSRSFKKLKEENLIKVESKTKKGGGTFRIVELEIPNGHGGPFANGHGCPSINNNNNLFTNVNKLYMSDFFPEGAQTSSKNGQKLTKEQEEQFEHVWKNYPKKSQKQEAKKYFLNSDYKDLLLEANIKKRQVLLEIEKKKFVVGGSRRMRDFTPQLDSFRHQDLKEIFERHMTMGGDMRTRMEELKADFPDVDFEQLHKERSDKKTENAIGSLIYG